MRYALQITGGIILAALASRADATVIIAKLNEIDPHRDVHMTFDGGANWRNVRAGVNVFEVVGGDPTPLAPQFQAFCTDVHQTISYNNPVTYTTVPLESSPAPGGGMGSVKADLLREMWGRYFSLAVTSDTNASAFQVAVWEIVNDTTLDLSDGMVRLDGSASTKNLAQSWLNSLNGDASKFAPCYALQSESKQDMFVPSSGTLVLAGIGAIAALRRRR